jgi:two-component system cell cycle sensor histidine kinase/response regulator CckA
VSERPATILVVEDNSITRKMMRVALESDGYRVLEAPDGRTALELVAAHAPALAIQDLLLPDIDGIELCRRLRATPAGREMPILACSGLQSKLEEARSLQAGFTDLLFKPVEPSRLSEAVRRHLHRPAAEGKPGRDRLVLLVDDDLVQRKLNKLQLEQVGFRVTVAGDGVEALEQARQTPPEAVVCDVLMPRMNGLDFCSAVRLDSTLATVPIVLTSSTLQHIEDADRAMARDLGANTLVPRTPGFEEAVAGLLAALNESAPQPVSGAQGQAPRFLDRFLRQVEIHATLNASMAQRAALDAALLSIAASGSAVLTRRLDLQQMLDEMLAHALDAGGVSAGAIYLAEGGDRLQLRSQIGFAGGSTSLADFFGHIGFLQKVMREGRPVRIPDAAVPMPEALLTRAGARSAVMAPLVAVGQPLGVLVMLTDLREIEDGWLSSVGAVATQLAQVVALSRAVSELARSDERYRLLFDHNPLPSWVFDRETLRIVAVNDEAIHGYGYSREEFLGLKITDLRPPGEVPALLEYLRTTPEAFHKAGLWRHRKKDGTLITVEISGHPLTWQGRAAELVVVNDLTERLQAEQALLDRDLRFRQLTDNMHEVFFVENAQLTEMLYVSPAYETIWGQTCKSLYDQPRSFIDPIPAEDRERVFAQIAQAQQGIVPDEIEFRVVRSDGTTRWLLTRAVPVRNEQGEVYRIAGVAMDITERKKADEGLSQRARLAELNAGVGVALTHGETMRDMLQPCAEALVRHLDAAFARIWTLNEQTQVLELVASAGLYTHIDGPHGRVPVGKFKIGLIAQERLPHLTNAVIGDPRVSDQEWARREGMVAFSGYPLIVADRVVGVMAMFARHPFSDFVQEALASIAHGIAVGIERKRGEDALRMSEGRARTLFETVNLIVLGLDARGIVDYVNPFLLQLTGYTREETLGQPWVEGFIPKVEQEKMQGTFRELLKHGSHPHYQNAILTKAGEERTIAWNNTVLRDAQGRPTGTLSIGEDITEQHRLEEQFRQAQKMEAVGRLAGGVAHDFNNMLTVITSYGTLLLEDLGPTDPRREDLNEILKAATGAASLTRQLLAFSRQQVLELRVLDLNEVVAAAGKMLKRLIGEDIELVTVLAPDLGAVKADPGQIEQVIMNLAVNARDAMPDGGKLTIESSNVELGADYGRQHPPVNAGTYVLLSVSDTGVGMDPVTQARLFEPFFTTKEKGRGTGLGLATVYGIVKQSAGFIWVYSEPGHGSAFKIYLPRVHEAPQVAPVQTSSELRGSETILVAEDAQGVRAVVQNVLKRHGYTVLQASDGRAALDLVASHPEPIDLLITDVIMPGMSGRQLADRLRELRAGMKVLFVSGYTDDAIIRHGMLEPGIAFLQKPFTPESLAAKVRQVLDAPLPSH